MNIRLVVVDQNGCRDTTEGSVMIHPEPVAGILSNASTLFCDGDSVFLTSFSRPAAGGGAITQFQWLTNGIPIPAAEYASLPVYSSGRFQLKVTDENQCSDTSEVVTAIAQPLPEGSLPLLADPVICEGARTLLTVQSNASSFQWYRNGNTLPAERNASLEVREEGTYTVEMFSANGCKAMADGATLIQMRVKPIPDFTHTVHCKDIPITFTNITDTSRSGSVRWSWDFGDGEVSDRENPVHTYSRGTAYAVKLKVIPLQCPGLAVIATKTVSVEEPLAGIRYKPVNAVAKTSTVLQSRTFGREYLWFPSTGLSNPQATRPQFFHDQPIEYTIRIRTDAGCITYDTVLVRMFKQSDILVPNAFTPNGDGHNDRLDVFLVGIREFRFFRVFNRWGQLLFDSKDPQQLWDGTFRGVKQPLETYVWIAEGISEEGESIIRRGQTLLVR
jgi:gliding motility-associated-like protein